MNHRNEAHETAADIAFAEERIAQDFTTQREYWEHFIEVNRARLTAMLSTGEGVARILDRRFSAGDPGMFVGAKVALSIKRAIEAYSARYGVNESEALRRLIQCGLEVERELGKGGANGG